MQNTEAKGFLEKLKLLEYKPTKVNMNVEKDRNRKSQEKKVKGRQH